MSDTDFKAVPMKLEEARYSYRNSQQISSQTGLIGYLRADMGTNGTEFWSTWNDFREDLQFVQRERTVSFRPSDLEQFL